MTENPTMVRSPDATRSCATAEPERILGQLYSALDTASTMMERQTRSTADFISRCEQVRHGLRLEMNEASKAMMELVSLTEAARLAKDNLAENVRASRKSSDDMCRQTEHLRRICQSLRHVADGLSHQTTQASERIERLEVLARDIDGRLEPAGRATESSPPNAQQIARVRERLTPRPPGKNPSIDPTFTTEGPIDHAQSRTLDIARLIEEARERCTVEKQRSQSPVTA